jgi:hypothetical protein
MKNFILSLVACCLLTGGIYAADFLRLVHVDEWGWWEQGYIDSAAILIEPKGLYAQCELILDFSSGGAGNASSDVLETEMGFTLPHESQITDLYLWIEGEPIQAYIFDVWTASLIYESIVERRVDPAILIKTGSNEYNLKVYPIHADMPRRVKIQFITPISNILSGVQSVPLPFNIMHLSGYTPESFKIAFRKSENYHSPGILENDQLSFVQKNDPDFGECMVSTITDLAAYTAGTMVFSGADHNADVHLAVYEPTGTEDKYFELALDHSNLIDLEDHKKAVYMLDFIDGNCSNYSKEDLLSSLKFSIRNSFSVTDSFNILVSGLVTNYVSDVWLPADSASLEACFNEIDPEWFNDYSNLPSLLVDGINFIKDQGNSGSLILIASSNSHGSNEQANSLIADYLESLDSSQIPIHIIDLDNSQAQYYYIGGQYFYGNEYFYTRLSQKTAGEYYSVRNYSLSTMLGNVNNRVSGYFKSLEVFIQTDGGYTYSNYRLSQLAGLIYNNEALRIVGKFVGESPFYISLYGQSSEGEIFHLEETILPENIMQGDSTIELCWSANYLSGLMNLEQSNQVVNQVINASVDQRILSAYTAFLVLEPDFVIPDDINQPEEDDTFWPTFTEVTKAETSGNATISNYPNPFSSGTTLIYHVPELAVVELAVYNSTGQLVAVLVEEELEAGDYTFELDATGYGQGVYFCIMKVQGRVVSKLKMVIL